MDLPTVTSTVGATIIISMLDTTEAGYEFDDLWTAPTLNIIVPWYVEDNLGNSHTFFFTVSFVDATPPVFDLMGTPPAASYNSVVAVPPPPNITAVDCTPFTLTYVQSTPPDTCEAGTFTRTWTATDTFSNTAVFTQTITITADATAPAISGFPQNGSAPCDQIATAYPNWLAQQMSVFTAVDASGIKSYSNNAPVPFPDGCAVPQVVTFKVTDNCNFQSTTTAAFSTSDNTPPVIVVEPMDTVAYCSPDDDHLNALGEWISTHAYMTAMDACMSDSFLIYKMEVNGTPSDSAQVVAAFLASYANGCDSQLIGNQMYGKVRGTVRVDFFVDDACGNSTFAGQAMFGAIDTLPPVITGIPVVEQCGGGNDDANLQTWINAHGNASVTDDCSATTWTNFSFTTSNGQSGNGNFGAGPYPIVQPHNCAWYADVTFRSTDDCGNVGSKTLRFRIQDTQKPVIAGFPTTVTLSCPNPIPTLSPSFVTDNCDTSMVIAYTFTLSDTLCSGSYTMNVIWSATDDCGNTGTATQTVLVRDTEGPMFTLVPPADTFRCDTFVLPPAPVMGVDIMATDNCSQAMSITTQDTSFQNPDPAVCGHYTYDIVRTFTATDACGNTRTTTQVISVIDNLGPAPGGLIDTTMLCEAQPFVTPPPTPVDACSGPTDVPVFVQDIVTNGPCDDTYTLTRNWQAQDVCGNTSIIPQTIHVVDTLRPILSNIPPDMTVECDSIPAPPDPSTFNATDNCDESVTVVLVESEIRNPDTLDCAHWANYIIRREWTATDNCGNASTYTQNISVQDNTGPVLVPPVTIMLPADPGVCGANMGIPVPVSLFDECTSLKTNVVLRDTALLVNTSGGPNGTTPVDTVIFQWASPNIPPSTPALAPVELKIYLETADAESPTEYFRVYGEGGYLIGQTIPNNSPPTQCGNGTTTLSVPAYELNNWLADGQLVLTLAPNGTNADAINALAACAGGRVRAELSYEITTQQVPITLTFSLDGDTAELFPPPSSYFLEVGTHTVVYTATDCAGNSTTASTTIEVQDLQPPMMTPPPADTFYVGQNCLAVVALPFPVITDNCDVSGQLVQASANLPIQFEVDPNAGLIPKDISLTIPILIPNAISGGLLGIRHKGDNDNSLMGEFFEIYDENNAQLPGVTTSGTTAGECSLFHETTFPITANQINTWAADATATFKIVANDDAGNFSDFIDPCAPLLPDMTDSVSRIQAVLEYSFAVVTYQIVNGGNQIVGSGSLFGGLTTDTLPPGVYTVKYFVSDDNGLEGTASYPITVLDTVKPMAVCESLTIQVNPSGLPGDTYVLQPSEVDNGSTDNCSGTNLTFQLSQTNFTCGQAGSNFNVTLTVTDASGNSSTCSAIVNVITTVLQPTYTPVCEGGNLQLFANPPGAASSYSWTGPCGFSSPMQNPTISPAQLCHEGTYCVTVTGLTGCTATGCVTVDLATLPFQPVISATGAPFCAGNDVELSTPTYAGQNVTYQWYEDALPVPILLGTTPSPIFIVNQPSVGTYRYFVKVSADGCVSVNSNLLTVVVNPIPPVNVVQPLINVCECETITLGTTVPPTGGLTYMWTGPGGFTSSSQNPLVAICADSAQHAGSYTLITKQNGCSSAPATVTVNVRKKPATPLLAGATQVCEGSTVTLISSSAPGIDDYIWQSPQLTEITTDINTLTLNNVMVSDSGIWRVRLQKQGCFSDWSAPILVEVQTYPDVTGSSNSPVCQGGTLQLSATSNILPLTTWEWSDQGGFLIYEQNPMRKPAIAGLYKVVGATSFGCADSAFVNVEVITPPEITSVTNTAPICADGSAATLQAVVISSCQPLTYTWTGPGDYESSDSTPIIPNVGAANSGTYNLQVTDNCGCVSEVKSTVVNVQNPPATPVFSNPSPIVVCAGANVTLNISNPPNPGGGNAIYTWYTPTGDTATTQPFLSISNAAMQNDGDYYVIVAVAGCISDTSAPIDVVVKPIPNAPIATANTPLCEGETLQLNTQNVFGATYQWTGPTGWSASVRNPTRPSMTVADGGHYSVTVTLNGCSATGEGVFVVVKPRPKTPFILVPVPPAVCLQQSSTLTLQLSQTSQDGGALYTWFRTMPTDTIGGPGFPVSFQTSNFAGFDAGPNGFFAVAHKDGCNSLPSNTVNVQFDTIPNNSAFAGPDREACASVPLELSAADPMPATGQWTQVTNFPDSIRSPNNRTTLVTDLVPGFTYQFAWTLSNGGCKNYSSDVVSITTFAPEKAAVLDTFIETCYASSVQIHAVQGQTVDGYWTQDLGQQMLKVRIVEPDSPSTLVDTLAFGYTYYYWNLDNGACGISSATVTVFNYSADAQAGADQVLCSNDSCTLLNASALPTGETGQWSSDDPNLLFSSPTSPATSVCNLQRGQNRVYWVTNGGFCGPQSRDTVLIVYDLFPTAVPDTFEVDFGTVKEFEVLSNDFLPQQYDVTVEDEPDHGDFDQLGVGQFSYQPDVAFSGEDVMIYKICNLVCPLPACSTAVVTFLVGEAEECEIFNLITPNEDNVNDKFFVPCLETGEILDNEVTIFNQYGDQVFHAKPYLNDWKGTYNGQDLPTGTYFYVVKFNGNSKPKTGFLQIQR